MKNPNPLLKVVAVASSVLLLGGFVAYRAGAFDSLIGNRPSDERGSSQKQPSEQEGKDLPHMVGSKSDVNLIQIPSVPGLPESTGYAAEVKAIMSGSKSLFVPTNVLPTPQSPPYTADPTPAKPKSGDGAIDWRYDWSSWLLSGEILHSTQKLDKTSTIIYGPKSAPVFPAKP